MPGSSHSALLLSYGGTRYIVNNAPQNDTSNHNIYDFTVDIGDADPTRRVFVMVHWQNGSEQHDITDVTINGVTNDDLLQNDHNGGVTGLGAGIASAPVPTGDGEVTISVNFSGGNQINACAIDTIIAYGLDDTVYDEAVDETQVTASDMSVLIDSIGGGLIIGVYTGSTNALNAAVTWGGLTEVYDFSMGGTNGGRASMAVNVLPTTQTGQTISTDITDVPDAGNDLVVQSWRPA